MYLTFSAYTLLAVDSTWNYAASDKNAKFWTHLLSDGEIYFPRHSNKYASFTAAFSKGMLHNLCLVLYLHSDLQFYSLKLMCVFKDLMKFRWSQISDEFAAHEHSMC